ncbi:hypothetical protein [Frigoribacterium faeni]|uniref:hypothetical protein n=1 Tax=Frigoribacterium faeni TaxID=145483 RepID=UPI00141AF1B9|nr:hypothetical protein [Frigoribacterium faeni]NIJ04763.1 hypothetical protein [Frigoribacterium faeni]
MSFFPEVPPTDDDDQPEEVWVPPAWTQPPPAWLPGRLPEAALLARTDEVAVAVTGVAVHPSGVSFEIESVLRNPQQGRRAWAALVDRFEGGRFRPGLADASDGLRFGVELADGATAIAGPGHFFDGDHTEAPVGPVLSLAPHGGSGDDRIMTATSTLWLWPLPADGPIDLVIVWPEFGIAETRHRFDHLELDAAARRARPYWEL